MTSLQREQQQRDRIKREERKKAMASKEEVRRPPWLASQVHDVSSHTVILVTTLVGL